MIPLQYITDFNKSRGARIGSSDIPALIPHPLRPSESLAGYGQTAITLWEEKTGQRPRTPSGFAAEMGHYIEPKAIREFIRDVSANEPEMNGGRVAMEFFRGFMTYEMENELTETGKKNFSPERAGAIYNSVTAFKHHTEAVTPFGVAHADCVYIPEGNARKVKTQYDFTVDFTKPFIIEAKSAQYWAARRNDDPYSGYDTSLKEWQGIPLKHYLQIQYQLALYEIDTAYLSLIYNTSEKHYWQIRANKKHQSELVELAEKMKWHIDKRKPPKELAMNADDIRKLYPEIKEDFCEISGDELQKAVEISRTYQKAAEQEKQWKARKEDAENAMAVLLKDNREITGRIGDKVETIARWRQTGGGEYVASIKDMQSADPVAVKYLRKRGLIKEKKKGEKPDIKLKIEEGE